MAQLLEYKCPGCGSPVHFDSSTQMMVCPYYGIEFDVAAMQKKDDILSRQTADDFSNMQHPESMSGDDMNGMNVFVCQSCGGEIVCDSNTVATSCPFCTNPVVMSGRVSGMLKPDYVIPFKLDKNAAVTTLKNYIAKKAFAPNTFKSENRLQETKCIYVPFWLFDGIVNGSVSYDATKSRHWNDSKYNYTETSHYHVIREGNIAFENIPVDGSLKMPDELMESIEPYNFSEAVPFQSAYLAGYLADKYDVTIEQSKDRANSRMKASTESEFRKTVHGYDTVHAKSSSVYLEQGRAKYALYPVWLLNTKYKDKLYTFAMNGQTGKLVGNVPVSIPKLAAVFASISLFGSAFMFIVFKIMGL
jgi:DNA-directed RNA polymerase subunit RPC12/RpoP